jgi:Flp pilus assembly CpaE family ATPase
MGTAALAARIPLRRPGRAAAAAPEASLAFRATHGPLVAICGLVGGAGASTLALLLAREASRCSSVPVLLAELHDHGALAALAGAGGDYGLAALAAAVENDQQITAPFTELPDGPRLVAATRPRLLPSPPVAADGLQRVLSDARAAHGLVVIDAGHASDPVCAALLQATSHVLFVTSATATALARTKLLADTGMLARASATRASLVAVATHPGRVASPKQLRQVAEGHVERLLLVPHIDALAAGQPMQPNRELEFTYIALASLLRSPR